MTITAQELGEVLKKMVDAKQRQADPYRPYIQFLIGLIAFSLAVITAVFAALPRPGAYVSAPGLKMLGGVLIWISLTAVVATLAALSIQAAKSWHLRKLSGGTQKLWHFVLACLVPVATGFVAVMYCIRGGSAYLSGSTRLPDFFEAFLSAF
jgi:hypothetical protein